MAENARLVSAQSLVILWNVTKSVSELREITAQLALSLKNKKPNKCCKRTWINNHLLLTIFGKTGTKIIELKLMTSQSQSNLPVVVAITLIEQVIT